ncbi:MAG: hypothetical protein AB8F78_04210 [Saprospiraceae bacterium]
MSLRLAYLLLAFVALVACAAPKQTSSAFAKTPRTQLSIEGDTLIIDERDTILLDAIGQLYHWSADNRIEKVRSVNQLGQSDTTSYAYQNPRLGRLTSVDFTNPIRPLLFYQDAQTVIWLNRNLSEWRSINLLDLGFSAIDAVAYAPNEGLWLYASDLQKLLQVDLNGKVVYQSTELNQVFNQAIRVEQLVANAQQVAMRTESNRLLLFGPFGAYRTELIGGGSSLHVTKDRLVFFEGQRWWAYRGPKIPVESVVVPTGGKKLVSLSAEFALYRRGNRYWKAAP